MFIKEISRSVLSM